MATAFASQTARSLRAQPCRIQKCTAFKSVTSPVVRQCRNLQRLQAKSAKAEATEEKAVETEFEDDDFPEQLPSSAQLGTFEMKVRRNTNPAVAAYAPAPVAAAPAAAALPSVAPVTPVELTMEETMDESLVPIEANKVGIFRRGRYAGGKKVGKDFCIKEKEQIKKGGTLGFIEQLGTFFEVKAPQAGEVVKFFVEDGGPVEYKQVIVEIAPFFGGHIIGDKKYA